MRIFTIGVGTPEGSLIPLPAQGGGTAFVKDSSGQVVKSKLDEKRLREIAESTGGMFLPLGNGTAAMQQLYTEGLSKMQAGDIDARTSRQPIERYHWPLAAADSRAQRLVAHQRAKARSATSRGAARPETVPRERLRSFCCFPLWRRPHAPGLDEYRDEKYPEAFERFSANVERAS